MKPVLVLFALITATHAQLSVTVSTPKLTGQKAVVRLELKNDSKENIESTRAVVFLLDEHGKMAAQGTRWIIGGEKGKPGLASGGTNSFYFVLTAPRPFASTNLTAKLTVSRIVLEGGNLADPQKDVKIERASK